MSAHLLESLKRSLQKFSSSESSDPSQTGVSDEELCSERKQKIDEQNDEDNETHASMMQKVFIKFAEAQKNPQQRWENLEKEGLINLLDMADHALPPYFQKHPDLGGRLGEPFKDFKEKKGIKRWNHGVFIRQRDYKTFLQICDEEYSRNKEQYSTSTSKKLFNDSRRTSDCTCLVQYEGDLDMGLFGKEDHSSATLIYGGLISIHTKEEFESNIMFFNGWVMFETELYVVLVNADFFSNEARFVNHQRTDIIKDIKFLPGKSKQSRKLKVASPDFSFDLVWLVDKKILVPIYKGNISKNYPCLADYGSNYIDAALRDSEIVFKENGTILPRSAYQFLRARIEIHIIGQNIERFSIFTVPWEHLEDFIKIAHPENSKIPKDETFYCFQRRHPKITNATISRFLLTYLEVETLLKQKGTSFIPIYNHQLSPKIVDEVAQKIYEIFQEELESSTKPPYEQHPYYKKNKFWVVDQYLIEFKKILSEEETKKIREKMGSLGLDRPNNYIIHKYVIDRNKTGYLLRFSPISIYVFARKFDLFPKEKGKIREDVLKWLGIENGPLAKKDMKTALDQGDSKSALDQGDGKSKEEADGIREASVREASDRIGSDSSADSGKSKMDADSGERKTDADINEGNDRIPKALSSSNASLKQKDSSTQLLPLVPQFRDKVRDKIKQEQPMKEDLPRPLNVPLVS